MEQQTYTAMAGDLRLELPIVELRDSGGILIALADTIGDWRICDQLAERLLSKARGQGIDLDRVEVILTAGKAVTLAESAARLLSLETRVLVADKRIKSFWPEYVQQSSRSITGIADEYLYLGGERLDLLRGRRVLVLDDVLSTGGSMKALTGLAQEGNETIGVLAGFLESEKHKAATFEGVPFCYLVELPLEF